MKERFYMLDQNVEKSCQLLVLLNVAKTRCFQWITR